MHSRKRTPRVCGAWSDVCSSLHPEGAAHPGCCRTRCSSRQAWKGNHFPHAAGRLPCPSRWALEALRAWLAARLRKGFVCPQEDQHLEPSKGPVPPLSLIAGKWNPCRVTGRFGIAPLSATHPDAPGKRGWPPRGPRQLHAQASLLPTAHPREVALSSSVPPSPGGPGVGVDTRRLAWLESSLTPPGRARLPLGAPPAAPTPGLHRWGGPAAPAPVSLPALLSISASQLRKSLWGIRDQRSQGLGEGSPGRWRAGD